MAGKKDKKDGPKTSLLPKSIAGIKVPKEVRRKLGGLAKHPIVADLLAAGLVALAAKLKPEHESEPGTANGVDKSGGTAQPVADVPAAAKPVIKRPRKPAAPKPASAAKPAAAKSATATAKPAVKRKPAAAKPAAAKPAAAKPRAPRAPKTSA